MIIYYEEYPYLSETFINEVVADLMDENATEAEIKRALLKSDMYKCFDKSDIVKQVDSWDGHNTNIYETEAYGTLSEDDIEKIYMSKMNEAA